MGADEAPAPAATADGSGATGLRPLRSRYVVAALLVLVALVTVVMWGLLSIAATDATGRAFARAGLPGDLTVDLHPGTWVIYVEGRADVDKVTVTDAEGRQLPVHTEGVSQPGYDHGGFHSEAFGTFEVPLGGMAQGVRISVTGNSDEPDTTFAVGAADDLAAVHSQTWGMIVLLVVNIGAAAAIVVVPIVRLRRRRHRADG